MNSKLAHNVLLCLFSITPAPQSTLAFQEVKHEAVGTGNLLLLAQHVLLMALIIHCMVTDLCP